MRIKKLSLFTSQLQAQKEFYIARLGFLLINEGESFFTVRIGWSQLTFVHSEESHLYHYCFLIPKNMLIQALSWMEQRVDILPLQNGDKIQYFESWDAYSFYFYDASGNIAECIVRKEYGKVSDEDFGIDSFLCVNEIGMPTADISQINKLLTADYCCPFWKGDTNRFIANGDLEGLFLLPNYAVKKVWFPTEDRLLPEPFDIEFESDDNSFSFEYRNELIIDGS